MIVNAATYQSEACAALSLQPDGNPVPPVDGEITPTQKANLEAYLFYLKGNATYLTDPEKVYQYINWLDTALQIECRDDYHHSMSVKQAVLSLKNIRSNHKDEMAFLERLAAYDKQLGPSRSFQRLVANNHDIETRRKIGKAWTTVRHTKNSEFVEALSSLIAARHRAAKASRLRSPLSYSLQNSSFSYDQLDKFLMACLHMSESLMERLLDQIDTSQNHNPDFATDYPFILYHTTRKFNPPRVEWGNIVRAFNELAYRIFRVNVRDSLGPDRKRLKLYKDTQCFGTITFDTKDALNGDLSWPTNAAPHSHCLLRGYSPSEGTVPFQSLRTLFHEFGHALAHCLTFEKRSDASQTVARPYEREELLSHWMEYESLCEAILNILDLNPAEPGVKQVRDQRIMATIINFQASSLCAYLDLTLHHDDSVTLPQRLTLLRDQFPTLQQRQDIDLLSAFTHYSFVERPGAAYVFPLSDAFAASRIKMRSTEKAEFDGDCTISPHIPLHVPSLTALKSMLLSPLDRPQSFLSLDND